MNMIKKSTLFCLSFAALTSCNPKPSTLAFPKSSSQEVRIALNEDCSTCDPRKARNLCDTNLVRFLFEGLMRKNSQGNLEPALAENYEISPDGTIYTFTLRNSNWSNGEKITAQDVEYSLKSSLEPSFAAPNAYQLFVIKNAKAYFDGKVSLDSVGIQAKDSKTLEITLDHPTPYFLELLTFHPFFPVSEKWVKAHPEWKDGSELTAVTSGPYMFEVWQPHSEIVLKKNTNYFDAQKIKLEKIHLNCLDENTALNMFEVGDLDWTGSPTCIIPPDAISSLKIEKKLQIAPSAGTQFIRVNCAAENFKNPKMRKAFAYAVDRSGICDHVMQGGHFPATAFVPPCMGLTKTSFFELNNFELAKAYFFEVQNESTSNIPFKLSYVATERNQKIAQALQQNFKNALGIDVILDPCEGKTFYEKITKKEYQLALGNWFADFQDPINFLSIFEYKSNGSNNTEWENFEYQKLIEESTLAQDPEARGKLLNSAQAVLMNDMPIIPLFHFTFNYLKKDGLKNANVSPLGYIELKDAYIE